MAADFQQVRLVVVEDHLITRLGIRCSLGQYPEISIVGEAENGKAAVQLVSDLKPDIVLLDIGLPVLSGIDAAKEMKLSYPEIRIIMLTSHDLEEDVLASLEAKCDGYCLKEIEAPQLLAAIKAVHSGGTWLDPQIAGKIASSYVSGRHSIKTPDFRPPLTEREISVLQLVVDGLSNQQIAEKLFLSTETVKTHMRHLMEKLSVSDRTQAAVKALKNGIV